MRFGLPRPVTGPKRRRGTAADTAGSQEIRRLYFLYASLDKLAYLPADTRMLCGHEYTAANCRFALEVEPDNEDLQARAREVDGLREKGRITLPSNIGAERRFNPFLLVRQPAVVEAVRRHDPDCGTDPVAVFAALRRWKDRF